MNLEELAFFNLQLGGMVRSGIPLEGALKQLSETMRRGALRQEVNRLTDDLAKGTPLKEAVQARKFPVFYGQMLLLGARSQDLPAVLIRVSDYYQRMHSLWTRLKGMLVYPVIVLVGAFLLSAAFSAFLWTMLGELQEGWMGVDWSTHPVILSPVMLWVPPLSLLAMIVAVAVLLWAPGWRQALRWRVPGFREAALAQLADSFSVLLQNGCSLAEAASFMEQATTDRQLRTELGHWQGRLASGVGPFAEMVSPGRLLPPLFVWMVGSSGEDLAGGFRRASELYGARAQYRYELFLYAVLPVSVLLLGGVVLGQVLYMARVFVYCMDWLGGTGF